MRVKVTVLHRMDVEIASGETRVRDPHNDADVLDAADAVMKTKHRKVDSGMKIRVEERSGGRWRLVRELIA